ncbi:hypothetical protein PR048_016685 [Dryococelus australis]|uniref:Uncharacterized protein n=1 Tax=Dryococelus australis TaxID=614101 RepID=A0ABQ9H7C7_9NEOP|nr:hypothetical protein PR048_016685 [Dryococelus australis]
MCEHCYGIVCANAVSSEAIGDDEDDATDTSVAEVSVLCDLVIPNMYTIASYITDELGAQDLCLASNFDNEYVIDEALSANSLVRSDDPLECTERVYARNIDYPHPGKTAACPNGGKWNRLALIRRSGTKEEDVSHYCLTNHRVVDFLASEY